MPSMYFQKTGMKNPGHKAISSPFPFSPLSDEKVDKEELAFVARSFLAASTPDSQQERFFEWGMELLTERHNPLCHIRETTHNDDDPYYWELTEWWSDLCFIRREMSNDARALLSEAKLSQEQRKFIQIELAWADHGGQDIDSGVTSLRFYYLYSDPYTPENTECY